MLLRVTYYSCAPDAPVQLSRGHRRHGFRVAGPRGQPVQGAAQRGVLRHSQPARPQQDGRRGEGARFHVRPRQRNLG